jgi:hypothetical protein
MFLRLPIVVVRAVLETARAAIRAAQVTDGKMRCVQERGKAGQFRRPRRQSPRHACPSWSGTGGYRQPFQNAGSPLPRRMNLQALCRPHQVGQGLGLHLVHHARLWTLTVISLMPSSVAICLLSRPPMASSRTSRSRGQRFQARGAGGVFHAQVQLAAGQRQGIPYRTQQTLVLDQAWSGTHGRPASSPVPWREWCRSRR